MVGSPMKGRHNYALSEVEGGSSQLEELRKGVIMQQDVGDYVGLWGSMKQAEIGVFFAKVG